MRREDAEVVVAESFWNEMRIRSRGTAERRGRLKPEDLLSVQIQLPGIEAQSRFVELERAIRRLEAGTVALDTVAAAALERLLVDENVGG